MARVSPAATGFDFLSMNIKHELIKRPNTCTFLQESDSYLEFQTDALHAHGFSFSQLIHYTLEPAPGERGTAPKQCLTLAFSTADVVVIGWRLEWLTEDLRAQKGGVIRTLPAAARYEQLDTIHAAITDIKVTPLKEAPPPPKREQE